MLLVGVLWGRAEPAAAVVTPTFPSCESPQGTLRVSYDSGSHGIPGDMSEHRGSDSVYSLTDDILTQCFCPENGEGIQTNWWRASSLSQAEIDTFKRQGWIYIPNGQLWGLDGGPYLTLNSRYFCGEGEGVGGGEVLGAAAKGAVLGLAATGGAATIYAVAGLGATSLLLGVYLRRRAG